MYTVWVNTDCTWRHFLFFLSYCCILILAVHACWDFSCTWFDRWYLLALRVLRSRHLQLPQMAPDKKRKTVFYGYCSLAESNLFSHFATFGSNHKQMKVCPIVNEGMQLIEGLPSYMALHVFLVCQYHHPLNETNPWGFGISRLLKWGQLLVCRSTKPHRLWPCHWECLQGWWGD